MRYSVTWCQHRWEQQHFVHLAPAANFFVNYGNKFYMTFAITVYKWQQTSQSILPASTTRKTSNWRVKLSVRDAKKAPLDLRRSLEQSSGFGEGSHGASMESAGLPTVHIQERISSISVMNFVFWGSYPKLNSSNFPACGSCAVCGCILLSKDTQSPDQHRNHFKKSSWRRRCWGHQPCIT